MRQKSIVIILLLYLALKKENVIFFIKDKVVIPVIYHNYKLPFNLIYLLLFNESKRKKCFILMMHSTHFVYGDMASDMW